MLLIKSLKPKKNYQLTPTFQPGKLLYKQKGFREVEFKAETATPPTFGHFYTYSRFC